MLNLNKTNQKQSQSKISNVFYRKVLPLVFLTFGLTLLFLIIVPLLNLGDGLHIGGFFFQSFHLAALYLPLYFITIGLLIYYNQLTYRFLHLMNWSFIPFLTLALALKTAFATQPSTLEQFLLYLFPEPGATVIMLALFALELVILARFWLLAPADMPEDGEVFEENIDTDMPAEEESAATQESSSEQLTGQLKQYLHELDEKVPAAAQQEKKSQDHDNNEVEQALAELDAKFQKEHTPKEPKTLPIHEELGEPVVGPSHAKDTDVPQGLFDGSQDLPPHLQHRPLLTDEEQQALSQVADMIAENSEEERRMAAMLESATRDLDDILSHHRHPVSRPSARRGPYDDYEDYDPPKKKSAQMRRPSVPAMTSGDYRYSGRLEEEVDEEDVHYTDYEPGSGEEINKKPFTSLFSDLVEADGVRSYADIHTAQMFEPYRDMTNYHLPVNTLLTDYKTSTYWEIDDETNRAAGILEDTLKEFNIEAQVTGIQKGPVITMFELLPAPGVKLSRIEALADNIAFRLAASRVRIVAPIPDKQAVGIEVPNKERSLVSFKEMVAEAPMHERSDQQLPIVLGKDIGGNPQIVDLTKMPHLLIAGSTGSGKSVCVNGIICSFLFSRSPRDVRMILIDPKVVELKPYNDIPHLLTSVITEPMKALQAMQWAVGEMERRYSLLDSMGVRNIKSYNKKIVEMDLAAERLSYLVIVIDEFADLMASCGKELEGLIARLAAKSRAAGIHLIIATQRPSVDVITGLIKANFPCRIAFMVASKTDSRIILDSGGAEQLLGKGDMLFVSSWHPFPVRIQGAYLSEDEVENVATFVKSLAKPYYIDDEIFPDDSDDFSDNDTDFDDDPLYEKAVDIVYETGKATASYLQRRLKVGYNRAARLIDTMEKRGVVGPANGSRPREILHQHS